MINIRKMSAGVALAALTAATGPVVLATPASASGDDVIAQGSCSVRGTWKLKAKPDNGRIETEFEVDVNRVGRTFAVRLRDNGNLFFSGTRTTAGPSGSFSVERRTANRAGSDTIRARAVRGSNVCAGSVTL